MNLYLKDGKGTIQRTDKFPIVSMTIGNYVANIFYVPDDKFDACLEELGQSKIKLDGDGIIQDNEVISLFDDSNRIDCFMRPDRKREKDREDFQKIKDLKARGNIGDINKN